MAHIEGAPEFTPGKTFEEQPLEYLNWCLDEADARVMQYHSELKFHIREARKKLQYRNATENHVKQLEDIIAKRREAEEKR